MFLVKIWLCVVAILSIGWLVHGKDVDLAGQPLLSRNLVQVSKEIVAKNGRINAKELKHLTTLVLSVKTSLSSEHAYKILQKTVQGNSTCAQSIETYISDLMHKKSYALKMLDSWGKPESGILQLNLKWFGRYYKCEGITQNVSGFKGQWCTADINNKPTPLDFLIGSSGIRLGICFPDSCSASNISDFFNGFLNNSISIDVTCPEEPHDWDALSIVCLCIICLFALLVISATLLEIYRLQKTKNDDEPLLNAIERKTDKIGVLQSSFSIIKNTTMLLNTEKKEGNIHCLHGMRFISMTWVILGHTFFFAMPYLNNLMDFANFGINHFGFMAIFSGTFSVDTFFFLSGLLVTFLGMRELTKTRGKINIPLMYLSRYIRLTPAYAFCILFSMSIFGVIGDGPYWSTTTNALSNACSKSWWTNLLYINNMYPINLQDECYDWGWYLANDMQFYLLAPVFLVLLYRKPKVGIGALVFGTVCNIAITGALSSYYGEMPFTVTFSSLAHAVQGDQYHPPQTPKGNMTGSKADQFGSDLYAKPWCRIGVYFIGMITGYIVHVTNGKLKLNKIVVSVAWLVTSAMELALVYGIYSYVRDGDPMSINSAAFYNAVSRPLWSVGLGWVVIACVNGYGGPVNTFLSWKGFIPLSRLTYTCYLVHPLILYTFFATQEVSVHYSLVLFVCYFIAAVVLANGFGYVVSMLVEVPMSGIQKAIFPKSKPAPKHSEANHDQNEDYLDDRSTVNLIKT